MSRNASIALAVVVLAAITGVLIATTTTETTVRTLALAAPAIAGLTWWLVCCGRSR
ncbi:MAG: hypothetical protein RLZZ327_651 [Actinomycetota bacterium]|jgi:hypothetical protein